MPIFPITHLQWQVLRAAKRSRKPLLGRDLRLAPTRSTKSGEFLTILVDLGLLNRVSGSARDPFEAVYSLTELGEFAAEYGEAELPNPPC
jgi:hypothetical protein